MLLFWIIIINLMSFIGALAIESRSDLQKKFFKMPRVLQQASVFLISGPPCILPFLSQPRFTLFTPIALATGIVFVIGAVIIEALAFRQIGIIPSLKPKGKLLTTGGYGIVRHPIYSGVILLGLGLALIFKAIYALAYVPVVAILFGLMTIIEEKGLIEEYGKEYMKKLPYRLVPYLF